MAKQNGKSDIKQRHGISIWKWTKQYLMHDKSRKNCLLFLLLLFREQLCWPNNGCYSGGLVKRKKVLKICRIFSGGGRIKVFNIRSNFSLKSLPFKLGNLPIFPLYPAGGSYNPLQFFPHNLSPST